MTEDVRLLCFLEFEWRGKDAPNVESGKIEIIGDNLKQRNEFQGPGNENRVAYREIPYKI